MNFYIDIQRATPDYIPVTDEQLTSWAHLALDADRLDAAEITIRLVSVDEITALNKTYRHQAKATNVLAFPADIPKEIELDCPFLGDVIICPQVLAYESEVMHKALEAHWALIVIHGTLHLLGYDHIEDHDANEMQAIETALLKKLGFENPYHEDEYLE